MLVLVRLFNLFGRQLFQTLLVVVVELQLLLKFFAQLVLRLFSPHHLLVFAEKTLVAEQELAVFAVEEQSGTRQNKEQGTAEDEPEELQALAGGHFLGFQFFLSELLYVVHLAHSREPHGLHLFFLLEVFDVVFARQGLLIHQLVVVGELFEADLLVVGHTVLLCSVEGLADVFHGAYEVVLLLVGFRDVQIGGQDVELRLLFDVDSVELLLEISAGCVVFLLLHGFESSVL